MPNQVNNPLHGKTLQSILEFLVEAYGWEELGKRITIKCFTRYPTIASSLVFLRKTPWARVKVENLYLQATGTAKQEPDLPPPPLDLDLGF